MTTTFEYKLVQEWGAPMDQQRMNRLGKEGWELVSVLQDKANVWHHMFKKQVVKDVKIKQIV